MGKFRKFRRLFPGIAKECKNGLLWMPKNRRGGEEMELQFLQSEECRCRDNKKMSPTLDEIGTADERGNRKECGGPQEVFEHTLIGTEDPKGA